jgi:hypothetical protein
MMMSRQTRALTLWTAAALVLQAFGGAAIPGLYRDNAWIVSTFRATDLTALVLDVPVLLAAFAWASRGSSRGWAVWLGTLYYVFYNNLYFLLGTAFNRFFLVYVAITILSAFALVAAVAETPAMAVGASVARIPRRAIVSILLACAAVLAVMWVGQSLAYVATGTLPQIISDTGGITHVVAALDLTAIVPLLVFGAVRLWRSRPWGFVVSAGMLVQGILITVDLLVSAPFQAAAGVRDAWAMTPLWAVMLVAFGSGAALAIRAPSGVWPMPDTE